MNFTIVLAIIILVISLVTSVYVLGAIVVELFREWWESFKVEINLDDLDDIL